MSDANMRRQSQPPQLQPIPSQQQQYRFQYQPHHQHQHHQQYLPHHRQQTHPHPHPHQHHHFPIATGQQYHNSNHHHHHYQPQQSLSQTHATSIPPRPHTQTHRPPKPQPQRSSSMPLSHQSPWKRIKFNFSDKNQNNNNKKRTFMDMINNNNQNNNANNPQNDENNQRKRRKLTPKTENTSFLQQCSIPYQSLINERTWTKKHFLKHKTQNKTVINDKPETKPPITCIPIKTNKHQKKKKHNNSKLDYNYFYNLLFDIDLNDNTLTDSDALIHQWDNILSALSFELIRNMARNELLSKELQSQIDKEKWYKTVANAKNKYFDHLHALNVLNSSELIIKKLFKNGNLCKFNKHLSGRSWMHSGRVNSLFAYISNEDVNTLVMNDDIRYNISNIKASHALYLWPDGYSYNSLDNFHLYNNNTHNINFINFIDQCLIPMSWMSWRKRDSFNKVFYKQQQNMRLQRSNMNDNNNNNKYNNKSDDAINNKYVKCKAVQTENEYFEGNLFLELVDFRYVYNSHIIDSYQYKQNIDTNHTKLLVLQKCTNVVDLCDIPRFYFRILKSKHIDFMYQIYVNKSKSKYVVLNNKYSFYTQFIKEMDFKYKLIINKVINVQLSINKLYTIYTNYKRVNKFSYLHNLNWIKQNKMLKNLRNELIELYYLSYYPLNINKDKIYQIQYQQLKQYKLNLEKLENTVKNKKKNKQYLNVLQRDQSRLTKLISSAIIKNKIETQVLLKLYPDLCLKASIKVMQVMNYVHYVRDQNLVRSQFNHKQIAKKMKKTNNNNMYELNSNGMNSKENIIIEGINESQKFLDFVKRNGNEKLFNMLESSRSSSKYLYDVGEENLNEIVELRKHPGQWIPNYTKKHYETKCCILKICKMKNKIKNNYDLITLRIDFIASYGSPSHSGKGNAWLSHNGLWIFSIHQSAQKKKNINFQYYINNCYHLKNIIYSQECLTLNCAAKLFYKHLRFEMYRNSATIVFSQNTKFDQKGNGNNNLEVASDKVENNDNMNDDTSNCNDVFQIL